MKSIDNASKNNSADEEEVVLDNENLPMAESRKSDFGQPDERFSFNIW